MKKFVNGDVVLVGLQPYFNEYVLVKYIDYSCYYPWLRKNRDIFFVYNFFVDDPFKPQIPNENSLDFLCNPLAMKFWGVPDKVQFIRNSPIISSKDVPHLYFKNSGIEGRLLTQDPLTVSIPEQTMIFSTCLGHYAPSRINSSEIVKIEFDEFSISKLVDIRIALELMKIRNFPLTNIFEQCGSDHLNDAKIIYILGKDTERYALSYNMGIRYFFDIDDKFRPFEYYEKAKDGALLIYFHDIKLIEKYQEIFAQRGFISNNFGWLMLFDSLSENMTRYDFVYNGHYYQFGNEAHLKAFEEMIIKTTGDPNFVANTLDEIPPELREKYFPSTPRCMDEETDSIEYISLNSPGDFLDLQCSVTGKRKEYIINLDVDKLFNRYNSEFEKRKQYANGYGWEELLINEFFPYKKEDMVEEKHPMLDSEGGALAIIFKKKSDCIKNANQIAEFLSSVNSIIIALEKNEKGVG
ncbi:MAG: hypothetical protein IPL46_23235 [Saprospiraceae bacterium]|nr:hypothetical protein [Saprospiraceae bacterium]